MLFRGLGGVGDLRPSFHLHAEGGRPPGSPFAILESPTPRPASEESLHGEPLQDIVVTVPSQHGAGGDQVPGERTVVPGLEERVTELLVCAGPSQVRPEGAEQDKIAGGEGFSGEPDERIRSSTWISSPSLAQQTHGLHLNRRTAFQ